MDTVLNISGVITSSDGNQDSASSVADLTFGNSDDVSRKRRRSRDNKENIEDTEEPSSKILIEDSGFNLTYFADEILIDIFLYLNANDLYALQNTCYRFYKIIQDRRIWRCVDLSSLRLSVQEIKGRLKWAHDQTHSIKVRGFVETFPISKWKTTTVTEALLRNISERCVALHTLEMYSSYLNLDKINKSSIKLTDFPGTLKRLVFNDCSVQWPKTTPSFFTGMEAHFPLLEELGIERCNWFDPYDLMVFSKVKQLRWLSLKGCDNVKEFVPYGSIATRFGFKKLEYLDIRHTPITDSDVQCFNSVLTLKEILLECPNELRDEINFDIARRDLDLTGRSDDSPSTSSSSTINPRRDTDERARGASSDSLLPSVPSAESDRDTRVVNNRFVLNPDRILYISLDQRRRQRQQDVDIGGEIQQYLPVAIDYAAGQPFFQRLNYRLMDRALNFERERVLNFSPPRTGPVTDRGVFSFGRPRNSVQEGLICIRSFNRPDNNSFERMTIRHYKHVTDLSLLHLVQCSPNLIYLDVTGTSVTKGAIENFKDAKPECVVISHHI